jgi:hypothetical protein
MCVPIDQPDKGMPASRVWEDGFFNPLRIYSAAVVPGLWRTRLEYNETCLGEFQ